MDKIKINGENPLNGKIKISGAKNSALKLMAASILTDETLTLTNVPYLKDVTSMISLLSGMGVKISLDGTNGGKDREISFNCKNLEKPIAPYELVKTMRASAIVLGPLLAKHGHAEVSLPGGCAIDERPLNIHISELEKLGAVIKIENGSLVTSISVSKELSTSTTLSNE
jgi:UDP-N-acetylglucosamine 1-carboxyvinyltransferase